jgi:predicted molibdopterin-dependent oxidoreductase YjgC
MPTVLADLVQVVLPLTNVMEEEGTFTNHRGLVQRFLQAKTAPGVARPSWFVLSELLHTMGEEARFYLPSDVFRAITATFEPFAHLTYDQLGLRGAALQLPEKASASGEAV